MVASSLGERREQKFGDLYNFYENTNFNKFLGSKHQKSRSMALSSKLCFLFIRILARLFTLCTVVTEPFWLFLTQHAGLFRKVCALCFGNIFRGPLRRRSTTRPLVSTFISFFAISGLCRCRRLEQQLQLLPPRPPPVRKESKTRSDFLLCSLKLATPAERVWVGEREAVQRVVDESPTAVKEVLRFGVRAVAEIELRLSRGRPGGEEFRGCSKLC